MNQNRSSTSANRTPNQFTLVVQGVSWLSGISLFSAGMVFAQSSPETSVPSAEDLLQPDTNASSSWQGPAIDTAPEEPFIAAPEAQSIPLPEEVPIEPSIAPPEASPELAVPAPPPSPLDQATPATPDSLISPNLAEEAEAVFGGNESHTENYIDPTPYSLGATRGDQPNVILSERSTGCQAVLSPGQSTPTSICPQAEGGIASYSTGGSGSYDSPGLTVTSFQSSDEAGFSARSFYNLTVRPPARLSNGNISLLFPVSIPAAITSAFGWRLHPVMGDMRFHSGTDIGAPEGTPVLAAFDGKVEIADFVGGYGLTVVLQHNKGLEQTLYAHMSEIFVQSGEEVKQGEVIGRVGSTGLSTGPHLHFEFRKLTQEGWVVMDAGSVLEQALAQLIQSLQIAQANKTSLPALFKYPGKSLRVAKAETPSSPEAQDAQDAQQSAETLEALEAR